MKRIVMTVLIGSIFAGAAAPALAQFVIEDKKADAKVAKVAPRMIFIGQVSKYELSRGMGRDIPLGEAVAQIVPKGWEIEFDLGDRASDLKRLVTWRGGSEWPYTLEETLKQVGMGATVNSNLQMLTISKYQPDHRLPEAKKPATVATAVAETKPVVEAIPAKVWHVRASDKSVRSALIRWGKEANWDVSWEAPFDYPVLIETKFSGSFEEVAEKVAESLKSAEKPIQVVFYENRVARVVPYGTVLKAKGAK